MLSALSNSHDGHHLLHQRASAKGVVTGREDGKVHLLLAASGSVATIKLPEIVSALARHPNLSIRLVLTASAARFLAGQTPEQPTLSRLAHLPNVDGLYTDEAEWSPAWKRGAPILHIELRKCIVPLPEPVPYGCLLSLEDKVEVEQCNPLTQPGADLLVIAPLSANTLAKITNGLCDDLLSSIVRAWDTTGIVDGRGRRRILVAPAMNTCMWRHPITGRQLRVLEEEWGGAAEDGWFDVLRPIEKTLACGDTGDGAMKAWQDVVAEIERRLGFDAEVKSG